VFLGNSEGKAEAQIIPPCMDMDADLPQKAMLARRNFVGVDLGFFPFLQRTKTARSLAVMGTDAHIFQVGAFPPAAEKAPTGVVGIEIELERGVFETEGHKDLRAHVRG